MLDFLIFIEEQDKEDDRIEAYKSTMLTAFPGYEMWAKLYSQEEEEEGLIEVIPEDYEDIRDIIDIINEVQNGSIPDLTHG